jgi:hypothetical protein
LRREWEMASVLENSSCIDKHVTLVLEYAVSVLYFEDPLPFFFIPDSIFNKVLILDVFFNIVLGSCLLQISVYLA